MRTPPEAGDAAETFSKSAEHLTSNMPAAPLQDSPPHGFNPVEFPILALHWFMIEGVQP